MAALSVVVALKWSALLDEVDSLSGQARPALNSYGLSAPDRACLELGLRLAEAWGCHIAAVTVGPAQADAALRQAGAVGVTDLRRIDRAEGSASRVVASELAGVCTEATLLICGNASADRGSGTVGAFAAAQRGTPMALGLVKVERGETPGVLVVERRLDRGARERLEVRAPAVISVEGSVATLRRASLAGALSAAQMALSVGQPGRADAPAELATSMPRQHRVRTRRVAAPSPALSPQDRVLQLSGARGQRRAPRLEYLEPAPAADAILAQLAEWGYLP